MLEGKLFDIQHFGVHDGPGIRTLVFMKGCPLRCAWCCNPESQSGADQLRYLDFKCKACFQCVSACPYGSIKPRDESVEIDCTRCSACLEKPCLNACNHGALILTGFTITSGKLVEIISRDMAFYRNSGGGVTFTGGEPLLQPGFLAETLLKCKEAGIHTAIETCGYGRQTDLEAIIPLVDLFLFDIKIVDPGKHLEYTGISNRVILDNLAYLSDQNKRIIIRFPLIPGITDTEDNIGQVILLMKKLGLKEIDLEPYNSLGTAKYSELGIEYKLSGIITDPIYPADRLKQIRELFVPLTEIH